MSRSIFKKFSGSKLNANQNFYCKSDELDLERQVNKLQHVEDSCKVISKHAKDYSQSLVFLSKNESKMIKDISASDLCNQEDDLREQIENWLTVTAKLEQITPDLENVLQKAVLDPVKKYQTFYSGVHTALKKRESLLQECIKHQNKLEKLSEKEKTAQNIVKIDQAKRSLEASKQEFIAHNSVLLRELPQLYETRIEYFQPCLEALIRAQVNFYGEEAQIVGDVIDRKEAGSMPSPTGDLIEKKLVQMKNLSIVDDN